MKNLIVIFLAIFIIACSETEEKPMESTSLICEDDPFQFSLEVSNIALATDSCWLAYLENPSEIEVIGGNPAVIKWTYPGFPEWDTSNSLAFSYDKDTIESGQSYAATQIIGVVQFDGSNGEMFQSLGDQTLTVQVTEYDAQLEYICGTFEGKALFTDYQVVDLKGSFKGYLRP